MAMRWKRSAALLVSLLLILGTQTALAEGEFVGAVGSTDVSIRMQSSLEIVYKTPDVTMVSDNFDTSILEPGEKMTPAPVDLKIEVEGNKPFTYLWECSADGGKTYAKLSETTSTDQTEDSYTIASAVENTPNAQQPYFYKVTVTDKSGETVDATIKVLVSDDYWYKTREMATEHVAASAYMHKDTRLVVTEKQLHEYPQFEPLLASGMGPIFTCDVELINGNGAVVPYFGQVKVRFEVGEQYKGQTLRVLHQITGGTIEPLEGTVDEAGKLEVTVNSLSPFLIEGQGAHTITASTGSGGTITPTGAIAAATGASRTFTVQPNVGCKLDNVRVDGAVVELTDNRYTFTDIAANHRIEASFIDPNNIDGIGGGGGMGNNVWGPGAIESGRPAATVIASAGEHGSISPSGSVGILAGVGHTFYFYPEDGYEVDKVLLNGTEIEVINNSYTITVAGVVPDDITLHVTFRKTTEPPPQPVTHTVKVIAEGEGGKVSPEGDITVVHGGDLYVYALADPGYVVGGMQVDGTAVPHEAGGYHLTDIVQDHAVQVTFRKAINTVVQGNSGTGSSTHGGSNDGINDGINGGGGKIPDTGDTALRYYITTSVGPHGSISPYGIIAVPPGGSQTLYFYPADGYAVDQIFVNGVMVGEGLKQYTIEGATQDQKVEVTFRLIGSASGACHCLWFRLSGDCLICGGQCITPWCDVVPLLIFGGLALIVAVCGAARARKKHPRINRGC